MVMVKPLAQRLRVWTLLPDHLSSVLQATIHMTLKSYLVPRCLHFPLSKPRTVLRFECQALGSHGTPTPRSEKQPSSFQEEVPGVGDAQGNRGCKWRQTRRERLVGKTVSPSLSSQRVSLSAPGLTWKLSQAPWPALLPTEPCSDELAAQGGAVRHHPTALHHQALRHHHLCHSQPHHRPGPTQPA